MRAVILQPMYIPWAGYFGMIEQADTFVFYDDVQFVRRSWQRRNRIKVPGGEFTWVTVPVEKDFGQDIDEVEIKANGWRDSHWKSIHHSYANAAWYDTHADDIAAVYETEWNKLAELDIHLVKTVCSMLGIDTEFVRSSELNVQGQKTDRLIDVLEQIDADEYVSGPAAKDYIKTEQFEEAGIDLYWHDFDHPEYEQLHGEFLSHLSIVDMLFNVGAEQTRDLIVEHEKEALVPATE